MFSSIIKIIFFSYYLKYILFQQGKYAFIISEISGISIRLKDYSTVEFILNQQLEAEDNSLELFEQ